MDDSRETVIAILQGINLHGGPAPDPCIPGDASGNGTVNVSDAVHLVNHVFKGGPAPVEPCCP